MRISDWSSDVCSSDLGPRHLGLQQPRRAPLQAVGGLVRVGRRSARLRGADRPLSGRAAPGPGPRCVPGLLCRQGAAGMSRAISAAQAKALVHDGAEIAFLYVREAGEFGDGHPRFAIPCPYSTLEARIGALVPRRHVRVLLIDGGDGIAARAAAVLRELGYRDVSTVAGGTPGWAAAGFTLFQGVNVPSKTLGELAEHVWHPQTIDAPTLKRWQDGGRTFRFFDARPPEEYAKMRRSEEHTSELQSLIRISYAVFCLKKKKQAK